MEKKKGLRFQGRHRSKKGVISMLLAIMVLIGFVALTVISTFQKGKAGIVVGYLGFACLLVSVISFIAGVRSTKEKDIVLLHPIFGMVLSGIEFIFFVVLYLIGFIL